MSPLVDLRTLDETQLRFWFPSSYDLPGYLRDTGVIVAEMAVLAENGKIRPHTV